MSMLSSTPCIIASFNCHADIVDILMNNGADVNAKNNRDITALMYSAFQGSEEIAKILIDCGANLNAKDKNG